MQSVFRAPAGVLQQARRPGEDPVLGSGRLGDLVQAPGSGHVCVSVRRDGAAGGRRLGTGGTAGGHRLEPRRAAQTVRVAAGAEREWWCGTDGAETIVFQFVLFSAALASFVVRQTFIFTYPSFSY